MKRTTPSVIVRRCYLNNTILHLSAILERNWVSWTSNYTLKHGTTKLYYIFTYALESRHLIECSRSTRSSAIPSHSFLSYRLDIPSNVCSLPHLQQIKKGYYLAFNHLDSIILQCFERYYINRFWIVYSHIEEATWDQNMYFSGLLVLLRSMT